MFYHSLCGLSCDKFISSSTGNCPESASLCFLFKNVQYLSLFFLGPRGGAGGGRALQAGRSRVRFPMVSLEFFIDTIRPHYGPGADSASNKNKCQEYFLVVKGDRYFGLTAVPPSCADCFESWEP